jgi:hypothetical protein
MPELPDINAYLCALDTRIVGQTLEKVRVASPFVLRETMSVACSSGTDRHAESAATPPPAKSLSPAFRVDLAPGGGGGHNVCGITVYLCLP